MSADVYKWCLDYGSITAFGAYLRDEGFDADQLQEFYESPWKWTAERYLWLSAKIGGRSISFSEIDEALHPEAYADADEPIEVGP
jgi:hypothetical protein